MLLKRQRRANILPPPWLNPEALSAILDIEVDNEDLFSPPPPLPAAKTLPSDQYLDQSSLEVSAPFLPSSTSNAAPDALPYHWLELSHMLLAHASDDFEEADTVRGLLRDLKEVRMAKLRKGIRVLDAGAGVQMNGVGALEIAESRSFFAGVVDGLRYSISYNSHSASLLTYMSEELVLRENRRGRRETQKMPRMATLRAQSMTKTMTCYDKIPHIALFCFFLSLCLSLFVILALFELAYCPVYGCSICSPKSCQSISDKKAASLFVMPHPLQPVAPAARRITIPS